MWRMRATVTPFLNKIDGISKWSVDTNNPDTLAEIKSLRFSEGFGPKDGKNIQTFPGRFPMEIRLPHSYF